MKSTRPFTTGPWSQPLTLRVRIDGFVVAIGFRAFNALSPP